MAKGGTRQAIILTTLLGIAGLVVVMPGLAIGEVNPPAVTTQSGELAEAEKFNQQVIKLSNQGKYNEAIPLAERVLAIRKKLLGAEHPLVATSLNDLALLYYEQGRYTEAEPLYDQALEMMKRLLGNEHPDVATSLNNLAALYYEQGRYTEAELHYRKALDMRQRLLGKEHPLIAHSLNNLAALYRSQGRYTEAEPLYRQALDMRQRLLGKEHPLVAHSLNNLALLYDNQGRYAEAETLYRQALEIMKRSLGKEHPDVATNLNNLAGWYDSQGRYTEAETLYRQALDMRQRLLGNEHPLVALSLSNLAALYSAQGRYTEAETLHRQALDMRQRLLGNEHPLVAQSLNNLAGLYSVQGRYTEAEPLYRQALDMRQRLLGKKHPYVATNLNNFAFLYYRQGNIVNALNFLTQGLEIEESNLIYNLSTGFEGQKLNYIKTISDTTNATISLHLNSASNNPKATHLALTTVLQRKGRILDILTNNLQILRQRVHDPESQKLIDELSNLYSQLAVLIYNRPEKLPLNEYRQQVRKLEDQARQKEDELSRYSAEFRIQSQPVSVEAVQKLLPSDTALVELMKYQPFNPKASKNDERFGEPHYVAYVLNSTGEPQGIDLGEAKKIDAVLNLFRQNVRDSQTPLIQVKSSARDLDKIVMQPIRKLLGNTHQILISPDGTLNLIPFEALVDENDQFLVENYSFTYLTSGRDLLRLQNSFPSKQPPVIMADPYFERPGEIASIPDQINVANSRITRSIDLSQQTFPPLPGTAEEAKTIASLLGIKPLIGSSASKGTLQQLNSPKILHIATHGFFESVSENEESKSTLADNPLLLSGLVLAGFRNHQLGGNENGILTALETTALNLVGTKLVVLSACDTGMGKDITGEGLYGLRRALVIAGSESQVISLWKVDDRATKDLMVDYYKGVLANKGRSEALRQTQLQMLRGELSQEYQHPYYWATFIPSGNWRPIQH